MRAEHYIPEIDDPKIIHAALCDFRHEWDEKAEEITEIK